MPTTVRSYSKINLGLAIGPPRADAFHDLVTVYQTLELHDLVTVEARKTSGSQSRINIECNHPLVPCNGRNTAWRIVDSALNLLGITADVTIQIEKRLPVQGGLGAGSANAAAALFGLEREVSVRLPGPDRLKIASEIGSDVPLFLVGGAILGLGRGEQVYPLPDLPSYECVIAAPEIGVSTPQAFRDWDAVHAQETGPVLTQPAASDNLERLSRAVASAFGQPADTGPNSSGVASMGSGLAGNPLPALVQTGIENDFEQVVFPQYPLLGTIKRLLADSPSPESRSIYAALSGSGSAVFGLYASSEAAQAAKQRVQSAGVQAIRTRTLPRAEYWREMLEAEGNQTGH